LAASDVFVLDLIEAYGSGIRRAQKAMKDNNSPLLVFESDNDIDDYTMVTAYINEEFASIRDKKDKLQSNRKEENVGGRLSEKADVLLDSYEKT